MTIKNRFYLKHKICTEFVTSKSFKSPPSPHSGARYSTSNTIFSFGVLTVYDSDWSASLLSLEFRVVVGQEKSRSAWQCESDSLLILRLPSIGSSGICLSSGTWFSVFTFLADLSLPASWSLSSYFWSRSSIAPSSLALSSSDPLDSSSLSWKSLSLSSLPLSLLSNVAPSSSGSPTSSWPAL